MGYFNSVIDENKDKSGKIASHSGMSKTLKKWLIHQQLVDTWRDQNKLIRDYTNFSGRHNSFSRIDYIFQRCKPGIKTEKVVIGSRTHSDNAPLFVHWQIFEDCGNES